MAPSLTEASFLIGVVQAERGRFDDARKAFETTLAARPGFLPARTGLAEVLVQQGRCSEAIAKLEEGLRLNPSDRNLTQALQQLRAAC